MTDTRLPFDPAALVTLFDAQTGRIHGAGELERRLSDLPTAYADPAAVEKLLAEENPLLYRVTSMENHNGPGQLHYALAVLFPGKVGREYFMTKGHFHAWRPAAEVYIGLAGQGLMLLEDEETGACNAVPLVANSVVYVPGHTAHRTINTGDEPLVYWGILSSDAGHDYGAVGKCNFRQVVVDVDGVPTPMDRAAFLSQLAGQTEDTD